MKKSVKAKSAPARKPAKAVARVGAKAAKAPLVSAAAAPKRRGLAMSIFLLLLVGVAAEGYLLWRKDQRSKMIIEFVNQIAPIGRDQEGAFCCARTMSTDNQGNVYILEEPEVGHRLQKFSADGKFLAIYKPVKGKLEQIFNQAYGLASDSQDNLYVMESTSGKIKVLTPDLKYVRSFDVPSNNCNGLAINSKDELVIGDRTKGQLLIMSTQGEVLRKLDGGTVHMGGPFRVCIGPKDSMWVLDLPRGMTNDPDVKGYTAEGNPIAHWTIKDFPTNQYNYIWYHPKGYLMVNDNRGNSLARGFFFFDPKGHLLGNAAMTNNGWVFKNISGFTVDPKSGDIYVNDNFMGRGGDRFTWSPDNQAK